MKSLETVISLSWLVFWVYWIGTAIRSHSPMRDRGHFRFRAIFTAIIIIVVYNFHNDQLGAQTFQHAPALKALAAVLFYIGLAIAVWARLNLGKNWGMPMSETDRPRLVTTGPYRWVRNPIYSGLLLSILASAVIFTRVW